MMKTFTWAVSLCFLMSRCSPVVWAGLYLEGKSLTIYKWSLEKDLDIFRGLGNGCQVKTIDATDVDQFYITTHDIERLQQCPLNNLVLQRTSCFQPSARIDLSGLAQLVELNINDCVNDKFVITGLPGTLHVLEVYNLFEKNFKLDKTNNAFGESLEHMYVTNASLCCPGVVLGVLGAECRYSYLDKTSECSYLNVLETLTISDTQNDDISFLRESGQADGCLVSTLVASNARDFFLTARDIEVLQTCPLKCLKMGNTVCFPPSERLDMSGLTRLLEFDIDYCSNDNFVITGLPDSLQVLKILGLTDANFDLDDTDVRSGEFLEEIWAGSRPSLCCPGVVYGREVPQVKCFQSVLPTVSCGLSTDGTELNIFILDHINILRHRLKDTCRVSEVLVFLPEITLTQEDIYILERCPLTKLTLDDSRCFSASVDLSGLTHLTNLRIPICRNSEFVITGLPASLQELYITGLAEFNVRLDADGSVGFGENVTDLQVFLPSMCCSNTQQNMFARNLYEVCHDMNVFRAGWQCGLAYAWYGFELSVDSRSQLKSIMERGDGDCRYETEDGQSGVISKFNAAGSNFYLTQHDVDRLSKCRVTDIVLPYTSCFSGSIDLSSLFYLDILHIQYCKEVDFTITGLPDALRSLDIRGIHTRNIHLKGTNTSFGESLHLLQVSNPEICLCPQAVMKMFGKPLAEMTDCGLIDTVYSAIDEYNYEGFQSKGFDTAISSCEHLIEDPTLRFLLWMSMFAMSGNVFVLFYRLVWDMKCLQNSHGIYPFNLAVADLLMGVYLVVIGNADTRFRGEYVLFDEEWRLGPICHLAGFLSTLSSETSTMFILLITIDRFLAIQFPFGQYRTSVRRAWVLCGATWLTGVLVASLPLVNPGWEVYSYNSICVGLPLNTDAYSGSGYAMGVFIGFNSVLFLMIAIGQMSIYFAMWANSKKASLNNEQARRRYKRYLEVARQLSLIVISDFLCWFPICIMGLMVQRGHIIPDAAYAWSAVVVMPVNSSINPLLYTLRHVIADINKECQTRCQPTNTERRH